MQKSEMGIATSHVGALPRPATLPGRGAKEYSVDADELSATVAGIVAGIVDFNTRKAPPSGRNLAAQLSPLYYPQ
jgi:hypothetical protein